jgi:hypothetical protein
VRCRRRTIGGGTIIVADEDATVVLVINIAVDIANHAIVDMVVVIEVVASAAAVVKRGVVMVVVIAVVTITVAILVIGRRLHCVCGIKHRPSDSTTLSTRRMASGYVSQRLSVSYADAEPTLLATALRTLLQRERMLLISSCCMFAHTSDSTVALLKKLL